MACLHRIASGHYLCHKPKIACSVEAGPTASVAAAEDCVAHGRGVVVRSLVVGERSCCERMVRYIESKTLVSTSPTAQRWFCDNSMLACPICLEPATAAWTSPCGHVYCYACIAEWVRRRQHSCPICRARLPPSALTPPAVRSRRLTPFFAFTWVNPMGVRQSAFAALHLVMACLAIVFFRTLRPATAPTTLVLDGLLLTTSLSTMGQILVYLVCNVSREWSALQHKLELRQSAAVAPLPAARSRL